MQNPNIVLRGLDVWSVDKMLPRFLYSSNKRKYEIPNLLYLNWVPENHKNQREKWFLQWVGSLMTIVEDDEEMHTDAVDAVEETVYLAIQDKNHNVKEINIMF